MKRQTMANDQHGGPGSGDFPIFRGLKWLMNVNRLNSVSIFKFMCDNTAHHRFVSEVLRKTLIRKCYFKRSLQTGDRDVGEGSGHMVSDVG